MSDIGCMLKRMHHCVMRLVSSSSPAGIGMSTFLKRTNSWQKVLVKYTIVAINSTLIFATGSMNTSS